MEFERHVAGGANMHYFDLSIRLKTDHEHLFRNIQRNEYNNLYSFIRLERGISVSTVSGLNCCE